MVKATTGSTGDFSAQVGHAKKKAVLPVLVIKGSSPNMKGRNWFKALGIELHFTHVESEDFFPWFLKLFDEKIAVYNGPSVNIPIVSDASPLFYKARTVPFSLREKVE